MTDNEKPDELMPCPFCGGEAKQYQPVEGFRMYSIGCTFCHARMHSPKFFNEITEQWNARAPQSPPVQSDEVREAVDFFTKGKGQTYACNYTKTLVRAAEQRVAGQDAVIEKLKHLASWLNGRSYGGGISEKECGPLGRKADEAIALLTAQKGE